MGSGQENGDDGRGQCSTVQWADDDNDDDGRDKRSADVVTTVTSDADIGQKERGRGIALCDVEPSRFLTESLTLKA